MDIWVSQNLFMNTCPNQHVLASNETAMLRFVK